MTVTGAALRTYLENLVAHTPSVHLSGVTVRYDSTRAAGARIVSAQLSGGRDIIPDARYTLILNDFLATGGDGLAITTGALRTEILPMVDLDALVTYLESRPQPVQAPTDARIITVPPTQ